MSIQSNRPAVPIQHKMSKIVPQEDDKNCQSTKYNESMCSDKNCQEQQHINMVPVKTKMDMQPIPR